MLLNRNIDQTNHASSPIAREAKEAIREWISQRLANEDMRRQFNFELALFDAWGHVLEMGCPDEDE